MVHPRDLLRVDSSSGRNEFSAPLDIVHRNQIDCGLSAFPCLNRLIDLEKFTKPINFLLILAVVGFLQGVVIQYVRGTSKLWSEHYNLNPDIVDWLVYADEIFIGFVALPVAYWGCRIKRPPWIGGLTVLLSLSCLLLIIPEVYHKHVPRPRNSSRIDSQLCVITHERLELGEEREVNYIAIVIICIFETCFAMASVSYISHGITYVDDNISLSKSSGYIGLVIAVRELGKQIGTYASWIPFFFELHQVFVSVVWISLISLTCLAGTIIAMFPKYLPSVIVNQSAVTIFSSATGTQDAREKPVVIDGFFVTSWRIIRNKFLIVSILSGLFVRSAMTNLAVFGKIYDQSRFLIKIGRDLSGYNDPPLVQFTTNLLKQPLVAIFAVTSGIFIAKAKPKPRCLFIWNIVVFSLVTVFFMSTAFFNCDQRIENELENRIVTPYCSADCGCSKNIFEPVCLSDKTYFSPCLAGCTKVKHINKNQKIFQDCMCSLSVYDSDASEGSCDADNCNTLWALSQVNSILSAGILASTLVINMVINMRSVLPQDKGMALGLELTFISIIPYLPIRGIYRIVAENLCDYTEGHKCLFYSKYFGVFMSSATIFLTTLSTIFASVLLCMASKIELYEKEEGNDVLMMENFPSPVDNDTTNAYSTYMPNETVSTNENSYLLEHRPIIHSQLSDAHDESDKEPNNALSKKASRDAGVSDASHSSLADLEDVGDSHDSTSSSYHDVVPLQENLTDAQAAITRKTSNEQLITDF